MLGSRSVSSLPSPGCVNCSKELNSPRLSLCTCKMELVNPLRHNSREAGITQEFCNRGDNVETERMKSIIAQNLQVGTSKARLVEHPAQCLAHSTW